MLDAQSWRLEWADDFSGPAGSPPDPGRWNRNTGGHGWGNAELQCYTDGRGQRVPRRSGAAGAPSAAQRRRPPKCWYGPCAYTSARLMTRETFAQTYGWFEARIQVPQGGGVVAGVLALRRHPRRP